MRLGFASVQFPVRVRFSVKKLLLTFTVARFEIASQAKVLRNKFGRLQIGNQYPEKTLRFFLLEESHRTLPHPHNRLVVGSSPTGPTTLMQIAPDTTALLPQLYFLHLKLTFYRHYLTSLKTLRRAFRW